MTGGGSSYCLFVEVLLKEMDEYSLNDPYSILSSTQSTPGDDVSHTKLVGRRVLYQILNSLGQPWVLRQGNSQGWKMDSK
jgi:hypothetical protein